MRIASANYQHATTLETACIRIDQHAATTYVLTLTRSQAAAGDTPTRRFTVSSEKAARALGAAIHVELKCAYGLHCVSGTAA